jgi:hypothetical protein
MNDEQLRQWYQSRSERPAGQGHPELESLIRLVNKEGPEAERFAALDHVMQCSLCRSDFELLRAIDQSNEPTRVLRFPRWLPLAAALVFAVGVTLWWRTEREPDVVRGTASGGLTLVVPADSQVALGTPLRFVWHALTTASRYRFELLGADGRVVFASDGADTAVVVPDSIKVGPGRYRWLVVATPQGGEPETAVGSLLIR